MITLAERILQSTWSRILVGPEPPLHTRDRIQINTKTLPWPLAFGYGNHMSQESLPSLSNDVRKSVPVISCLGVTSITGATTVAASICIHHLSQLSFPFPFPWAQTYFLALKMPFHGSTTCYSYTRTVLAAQMAQRHGPSRTIGRLGLGRRTPL